DILFGYGEFAENNHKLVPSGFVEEWWVLDLERALKDKKIKIQDTSIKNIEDLPNISMEFIRKMLENPFKVIPTGRQALNISEYFNIPLHPAYLHHFGNANGYDLLNFRQKIKDYYFKNKLEFSKIPLLRIPDDDTCRSFLYNVFCPHKKKEGYLELDEYITPVYIKIFCLDKNLPANELKQIEKMGQNKVALELFPKLTKIIVRDKAPYYMGTRMGRPEKAKERQMKPPVHALIPLGHDSGNNRILQSALASSGVEVDVVVRQCPKCGIITHENFCYKCDTPTDMRRYCDNCNTASALNELTCPKCGRPTQSYAKRLVDSTETFNRFLEVIQTRNIPNVKGVKGLSSEFKMPEPVEKGILRAKNDVWVFKDGTIRFDAIDIPMTHFTPHEIGISVKKIKELGYSHDYNGKPLTNPNQICELRVQDFIATEHCGDYFVRVANFIDDELEYVYNIDRFYNCTEKEDLIGHYFAGLAPHTSAAIVGRLIGFTPVTAGYGHPFWHAAKRRNCDGDEDGLMLLLDLLINFSRFYLPAKIGGKMDAPLVLSVTLNPNEIDSEAFNIDTLSRYELDFYEKTWQYIKPDKIQKKMGLVEARLGTTEQYEGIKFTHPTKNINYGPKLSSYKTMETMNEKIDSQLGLAVKLEPVDAADVVRKILQSHFTRDIVGNLRSFSGQTFRCPSCETKYRRMPLSGVCNNCGGDLILTVTKGGIVKYLDKSLKLIKEFDLSDYTSQKIELINEYVQSLTDNPKVKQIKLSNWFQ
ncbi:MAG: DNA polymerase II large subunit, partial [Candidatus Lokiarchaeota archaeon]|nr:DNA polymerase II large subunit [Candidatus Lokiarchaeota archaeon]